MKYPISSARHAGTTLSTQVGSPGIRSIVIDRARSQSPTFGGLSFGAVGQYEKLRGTAYGEIDPQD